ncbi:MAG: HAD hydrolase-like protein, partial [Clostridia bacterium]|nr:HAD hydrolase-like protein [Clostridia bacterium]
PEPDERIISWLDSLKKNGIGAAFVSNNENERIEVFNKALGLPAYAKSGKPFAKNLKRAMAAMGSDESNTAVLGDQLLTDVCAGKHIGLRAFLVPPIKDRTSVFFRIKRALEVPTIRKYAASDPDGSAACDFWVNKRFSRKNNK